MILDWREYTILALAGVVGILWFLVVIPTRLQLEVATSEKEQYKMGLEFQNATILANKSEYDKKLSELPDVITKIKTKYVVVYTNIDDWEGDKNATDCENSDKFLRSTIY